MAYLQITTRCNMTCCHCCFAATNKGEDMGLEVFIHALQHISGRGDYLTIGGGEPTINKHFFTMLDKAIEFYLRGDLELPPFLVTNGSFPGKTKKLIDYYEQGKPLQVCLSQDPWHDPIKDDTVWRWQQAIKRNFVRWDADPHEQATIEFRSVTNLIPVGRAADRARGLPIGDHHGDDPCVCDSLFYTPNGDVFSCGCKHTKLGNVLDKDFGTLPDYDPNYAHFGGVAP